MAIRVVLRVGFLKARYEKAVRPVATGKDFNKKNPPRSLGDFFIEAIFLKKSMNPFIVLIVWQFPMLFFEQKSP